TLYALSTMGSIAGTLLTTFVLIPNLGVAAILKTLGATLIVVAIITLPLLKRTDTLVAITLALLLATFGIFWEAPTTPVFGERVVVDVDTPYHHITVIDNDRIAGRELRFDRYVESAVAFAPPHVTLSEY